MLAGLAIGLAIVALVAFVRAGVPAWIGLMVAMLILSENPSNGLGALGAGACVWLVLRHLVRSRV